MEAVAGHCPGETPITVKEAQAAAPDLLSLWPLKAKSLSHGLDTWPGLCGQIITLGTAPKLQGGPVAFPMRTGC